MKDKALVLTSGALYGAFSAGFITKLTNEGELENFSDIYCYSVGTYPASFGLARQPDILEEVWREHVHGLRLINPFNGLTFGKKPLIKLEYLEGLFTGDFELDTEKAANSETNLTYVLTEFYTGKTRFTKPTPENMVKMMSAASAVPFAHGPVEVEGTKYIDSSFVYGRAPGIKEITEKNDKIVVVSNLVEGYKPYETAIWTYLAENIAFPIISKFYPEQLRKVYEGRKERREKTEEYMKHHPKIQMLYPENKYLKTSADTNKERINKTFDEGIRMAEEYLRNL